MQIQFSKGMVAVAISLALGIGTAWGQAQPQWKDRAEYDLDAAINKEANYTKRLELLNTWKEKYPASDMKLRRALLYLDAYQKLNKAADMLGAAKDVLAADANNFQGLYWTCLLTMSLNNTSADALANGEKAARGLGSILDTFFAAGKKPQGTSDEQWKKTRSDMEALSHRTLGWIAQARKNPAEAEKEFAASLKINPNDAELSALLGTSIVAQKKPERQAEALYHFARAASFEGPGALEASRRKSMDDYITKAYTQFHGRDEAGLQQLKALAKTQAFPPADFKLLTEAEVSAHKDEELAKSNPQLAFWVRLKSALQDATGDQYFDAGMKGALVPPEGQPALKGKVLSQEPAKGAKKVVLAMSDSTTPEATLTLDAALPGTAEPGTEIEFRGVASSYAKQPFMVNFDVEKKNVTGWPTPAPVKKTPPKKAGARKKK